MIIGELKRLIGSFDRVLSPLSKMIMTDILANLLYQKGVVLANKISCIDQDLSGLQDWSQRRSLRHLRDREPLIHYVIIAIYLYDAGITPKLANSLEKYFVDPSSA